MYLHVQFFLLKDLPFCSSDPVPCDMALKMYAATSPNSQEIYNTDRQICTCPDGNTCPSGWITQGDKTITRDILSRGNIVRQAVSDNSEVVVDQARTVKTVQRNAKHQPLPPVPFSFSFFFSSVSIT